MSNQIIKIKMPNIIITDAYSGTCLYKLNKSEERLICPIDENPCTVHNKREGAFCRWKEFLEDRKIKET